ncbi:MAG: DNA translocase FtsK 4TM domain-containing protein [Patescibacteria group bacterium]
MSKRGRPIKKQNYSSSSLNPHLSTGIIAVLLIIFAAIIFLSFYEKAGVIGKIINEYILSFLFGNIKYTVPFVIIALAGYMIKGKDEETESTQGIGALLFFISLAGIMHLKFPTSEMWTKSLDGQGGGLFGMSAWLAKTYLGDIAAYVLFFGLVLISFFLIFTPSVKLFISFYKYLTNFVKSTIIFFLNILKKLFIPTIRDTQNLPDEIDEDEDDESDDEEIEKHNFKHLEKTEQNENDDEDEEKKILEKRKMIEKENEEKEINSNVKKEEDEEDDSIWSKRVIIKKLPPLDLLVQKKSKPTSGDIKANSLIIRNTLHEFNIDVEMGEIQVGPTVTQFTLKPPKGVKLTKITSLSNDLALALAAHPIRIEAPIPGKSLVGIEVPNQKTAMVTFKELLESNEFRKRPNDVMIALGKDVAGKTWFADLPKMPHLLIAGTTGSGKTVCVNTIIMSLLYENTAESLRFIMVDPKRVELTMYNGIPHLLTPVITNTQKTVNALKWTIGEMERRFELFSKVGSRNIDSYNEKYPNKKIPHIVFIIDELADLMATAASDVEAGIIRLAQMARAVGIHLVVATQRPSVDVITGLMKANIPARIAFSVASSIDSRTILDSPGAEKLIGKGDMLFQTAELGKPVRIQGAFISETELKNVVSYLKGDEEPEYDESIVEGNSKTGTASMFGGANDSQDPLFLEAKQAIIEAGKASASLLQRRLKVGYARAARILDEMEEAGIIGPAQGAKPRDILITEEDAAQDFYLKKLQKTNDAGAEANFFDNDFSKEEEKEDEEFEDELENTEDAENEMTKIEEDLNEEETEESFDEIIENDTEKNDDEEIAENEDEEFDDEDKKEEKPKNIFF